MSSAVDEPGAQNHAISIADADIDADDADPLPTEDCFCRIICFGTRRCARGWCAPCGAKCFVWGICLLVLVPIAAVLDIFAIILTSLFSPTTSAITICSDEACCTPVKRSYINMSNMCCGRLDVMKAFWCNSDNWCKGNSRGSNILSIFQ